jgi:hypothetical protein
MQPVDGTRLWCRRARTAAGGGRPQAGLEVVEKLLTSITAGSGLALGQATSRSSWILLSLTADMRDQGLTQLRVRKLIVQASDGKPDHVTGRQGKIIKACLGCEWAEPSPLLVGQVDRGSVVGPCRVLGHRPSWRQFELGTVSAGVEAQVWRDDTYEPVHNAVRTVRGAASCQAARDAPGMRWSWDALPDGRSHSDTWVGCMV